MFIGNMNGVLFASKRERIYIGGAETQVERVIQRTGSQANRQTRATKKKVLS